LVRSSRIRDEAAHPASPAERSSTRWLEYGRQHWTSGFENGFRTYQNVDFVTECTTRRTYMLGFTRGRPPGSDTDLVDPFLGRDRGRLRAGTRSRQAAREHV